MILWDTAVRQMSAGRCTVTDSDRDDAITALKRVRARLESALQADANGQASRRNDVDASGHRDEAKMASSPVYKSWTLVGEAIEALSAVEDANTSANRVDRRTEGATAPDDLTSIRGIDAALAQHLASLGVTRFSDIAAWRSDDVHNVSQALGISRDISRQNWIEQAALLERRKAKSEIATAAPAREQVSDLRPELQEIVEAARKDAPAHDDAPSPLALELASQTLGERADATVAAASPVFEDQELLRCSPLVALSPASTSVTLKAPTNRPWCRNLHRSTGPRYPSLRFQRPRIRTQPSVRGGSRMQGCVWLRALNSPTASACTMSTKQQ